MKTDRRSGPLHLSATQTSQRNDTEVTLVWCRHRGWLDWLSMANAPVVDAEGLTSRARLFKDHCALELIKKLRVIVVGSSSAVLITTKNQQNNTRDSETEMPQSDLSQVLARRLFPRMRVRFPNVAEHFLPGVF